MRRLTHCPFYIDFNLSKETSPTPLKSPYQPQAPQEGYSQFTTIGGGKPIVSIVLSTFNVKKELDRGASISVISYLLFFF